MDPQFWKSKRVFVTGHTGFKGSWLSLWLQSLGSELCGYSLAPPTTPSLFILADVQKNMRSIEGDVRDLEKLRKHLTQFKPEIVIHMAAQPLVRESYLSPVETYNTNIMGTVHLLEALRQCPEVKACVVVTSDKCYENRETSTAYVESEPMGGRDPYASSKGCAELVTLAYRRSFFSDGTVASARAGNVVGGGDWAQDRLVPDILNSLVAGDTIKIRNPRSIRPWQHVLEPLGGYLLLCEKLYKNPGGTFAQAWNFGPQKSENLSVSFMTDELIKRWGSGKWVHTNPETSPHEATLLSLDSSKAHDLLKWKPKLSLSKTLDWIVEWHKALAQGANMKNFTLEQIKHYSSDS